jgi:hypothetical protein
MLPILITEVVGLISTWVKGKQVIAEAKVEREVKALTHEANWDVVQAEASKESWKDEWLTLLVSIPLMMAFVPGMDGVVLEGFALLEKCPTWYQYLVGVVFAASFGIKKVTDLFVRKV